MRLFKTLFRVLVRLVCVPFLLVLILIVGLSALIVFAMWPLMFEGEQSPVTNLFYHVTNYANEESAGHS